MASANQLIARESRISVGAVKGLPEIVGRLDRLKKGLQSRIIRRALLAGVTVMRDDARARVPVRSGALRAAIVARTNRKGSSRDRIVASVSIARRVYGFTDEGQRRISGTYARGRTILDAAMLGRRRGLDGFIVPRLYAHLVEFGTKPHRIKVGHSEFTHPGARAKPFLQPALDTQADQVLRVVADRMRAELDKEGV